MASDQLYGWHEVAKVYEIHPETILYTKKTIEANAGSYTDLTIEQARSLMNDFSAKVNGHRAFNGSEIELLVPVTNSENGIPVTVYQPSSKPSIPAILVYFHGGSLLMGSRKTHEYSLKTIAEQSGAIIVNVEYRLLPCAEDPMVPFNDALSVTNWVIKNKEAVGGCAESKIGIGGDSAGGQIASGITQDVQGLDFQVLIYPTVTDLSMDFKSCDEFQNIPAFTTKALEWRLRITNSPIPDATNNPRVHPLAKSADQLRSSPPTKVVLAQLDPLRDPGLTYAKKLKDSGVRVQEVMIDGVPHGFFSLTGIFKTKCSEAFGHIAEFIKTFNK